MLLEDQLFITYAVLGNVSGKSRVEERKDSEELNKRHNLTTVFKSILFTLQQRIDSP